MNDDKNKVYGKTRFKFSTLRGFTTLFTTKDKWLKISSPTHKVWLSRDSAGYCYIEEFVNGFWTIVDEYQCLAG